MKRGLKMGMPRRKFLITSTITLGGVIVYNFSLLASAGKAIPARSQSEATKEITMPHVIVKLWPGRSERQKVDLAEAIVRNVVDILGNGEDSVSVAIEEIAPEHWKEKVYKPDILDKQENLYKKPGYSM
jgi:4-oxalocrotonate tautomerase